MQCSTVKETCLFSLSPFLLVSTPAPFFQPSPSISFWLSLFSPQNTFFFFYSHSAKIKHSHYFPHPLSLSLRPFLFLSGHSSDRHCSAVVLLCLSAGESGPAFTLSSIAARVSSKAAIQPAQSLPTGNRPTKEKGAARLLCSAPSEAACLHHLL